MARAKLVEIVNRTTETLEGMFDGVPEVIPAGYKVLTVDATGAKTIVGAGPNEEPRRHVCELHAAEAYKRQNPRMGTQDPFSVDARDTEYLLGVEEWGDDITPLEQTDADELIDRSMLPDNRQNAVQVPVGRGGKVRDVKTKRAVKESRKARAKAKAAAQAGRRQKYTDERLASPTGMKTNYTRPGEG